MKPRFQRFIDWVFSYENIDGEGLCPTYLHRWTLLKVGKWFSIYLHRFTGNDWALDLHDHPKRFFSIGLQGEYWEDSWKDGEVVTRYYKAPWIRTFPPEHRHRVRIFTKNATEYIQSQYEFAGAWTIVIVGPTRRAWGFWHNHIWISWKEYVYGGVGATRKDC